METGKKIIVALDVDSGEKALSLVKQIAGAEIFKVGLKLFTAEGPSLLQDIRNQGKKVFLDLKLHDIPNTVAGAVAMGIRHGVQMMTLHASGGQEMLVRAAETALRQAEKMNFPKPLLLGVTVLTSLKDSQLQEIGFHENAAGQVLKLAHLALAAGMDGIVCSPREIDLLRKEIGKNFLIVAPGIRPLWAAAQDQKRIMTPSQAVASGADYIVIGRPILEAPSPQTAFERIVHELKHPEQGPSKKDPHQN